jgi:hypothetical protein
MRARDQLIGVVALAAVTYFGVLRIAEAKCDAAVGSRGERIDADHPEALAALMRLETQLQVMGQAGLVSRIEQLRAKGDLWVAPAMGRERWAAFVNVLGLVRRIYVRGPALSNPQDHLYPDGVPKVPPAFRTAFAWLSLAGAMRHELAHYDGATAETEAYTQELAWYDEVRASDFVTALEGDEREAWKWGLESAILSARQAARNVGAL